MNDRYIVQRYTSFSLRSSLFLFISVPAFPLTADYTFKELTVSCKSPAYFPLRMTIEEQLDPEE